MQYRKRINTHMSFEVPPMHTTAPTTIYTTPNKKESGDYFLFFFSSKTSTSPLFVPQTDFIIILDFFIFMINQIPSWCEEKSNDVFLFTRGSDQ